jgi:hypothetical protein
LCLHGIYSLFYVKDMKIKYKLSIYTVLIGLVSYLISYIILFTSCYKNNNHHTDLYVVCLYLSIFEPFIFGLIAHWQKCM